VPERGVEDRGAESVAGLSGVAAVWHVSGLRELERRVEIMLGARQDGVERERLRVPGPPAEEVMSVDDDAVRDPGVQPGDDRVSQRLPMALQGAVDPRGGELGVD